VENVRVADYQLAKFSRPALNFFYFHIHEHTLERTQLHKQTSAIIHLQEDIKE